MRRRSLGLWLILGGLALVALALFALVALETTVVGSGVRVACGSALTPSVADAFVCGPALRDLWLVGGSLAVAGSAGITAGIVLRVLTPRPISF